MSFFVCVCLFAFPLLFCLGVLLWNRRLPTGHMLDLSEEPLEDNIAPRVRIVSTCGQGLSCRVGPQLGGGFRCLFNRILKGPGVVVIPVIFPKVPQSSQPESIGFPQEHPLPLDTPPLRTL